MREDPLIVEFSSKTILDANYCKSAAKLLAAAGVKWNIRRANRSLQRFLPDHPGLYMFVWKPLMKLRDVDDRERSFPLIMYVGSTGSGQSSNSIKQRYREYAKFLPGEGASAYSEEMSPRERRLSKGFEMKDLEYWYSEPLDSEVIASLESRLIDIFTPPLNLQKPKVRPRRRVAAF